MPGKHFKMLFDNTLIQGLNTFQGGKGFMLQCGHDLHQLPEVVFAFRKIFHQCHTLHFRGFQTVQRTFFKGLRGDKVTGRANNQQGDERN